MNYSLSNSSNNSTIAESSMYDVEKQLSTQKPEDDDIKIYLANRTDIPKNTILLEPAMSHLIKISTDFHVIVGDITLHNCTISDSNNNDLGTHW